MDIYDYFKLFSRIILAGIVLTMYLQFYKTKGFDVGLGVVFCCLSFFVFEDFFKKFHIEHFKYSMYKNQ